MIPLLNDPAPLTHMVTTLCEVRIPEDEIDHFEDHPADLGRLVLSLFSKCAVVVCGVIYEETDEEGDDV